MYLCFFAKKVHYGNADFWWPFCFSSFDLKPGSARFNTPHEESSNIACGFEKNKEKTEVSFRLTLIRLKGATVPLFFCQKKCIMGNADFRRPFCFSSFDLKPGSTRFNTPHEESSNIACGYEKIYEKKQR